MARARLVFRPVSAVALAVALMIGALAGACSTSGAGGSGSGAGGATGGGGGGGATNGAGQGGGSAGGGGGGNAGRGAGGTSPATDARVDAPDGADARGAGGAGGGSAADGGAGNACKRGIATNTAPGAAFRPSVGWWYDWSPRVAGAGSTAEFVPMIWGTMDLGATLPAGSRYLLGFNEPNFHAQSNLTAQQAATDWPMLETKASAAGALLVSPAVNFCGPAASCNGTSPYQYLRDFFAACAGCRVDHIAVHWYNCDLPSLVDYLEPGGSLEGFEQFGKPIWLTEFSCDGSASAANQETFMRAAIPYLESNAHVFRYSWFSADPIPNARLVNSDGSPTALGQVYLSLPGGCR